MANLMMPVSSFHAMNPATSTPMRGSQSANCALPKGKKLFRAEAQRKQRPQRERIFSANSAELCASARNP
jgi:hypothetical protein